MKWDVGMRQIVRQLVKHWWVWLKIMVPMTHRFLIMAIVGKPSSYWGLIKSLSITINHYESVLLTINPRFWLGKLTIDVASFPIHSAWPPTGDLKSLWRFQDLLRRPGGGANLPGQKKKGKALLGIVEPYMFIHIYLCIDKHDICVYIIIYIYIYIYMFHLCIYIYIYVSVDEIVLYWLHMRYIYI